MTTQAFDPDQLTPIASLNRVRIVDLPGITLAPDVRGKRAFELLGKPFLAEIIRRQSGALELTETAHLDAEALTDDATLRAFDRCLASDSQAGRRAANEIARDFGRRLGYLALTLKRGDSVNRLARAEWSDAHWRQWSETRAIWLGGGVVSGRLGPLLRDAATEALAEHGVNDLALRLSSFPAHLPLVGAACSLQLGAEDTHALALDFGGSFVKRAYADYVDGALASLRLLAPLPVPWLTPEQSGDYFTPEQSGDYSLAQARQVADFMREVIIQAWKEAQHFAQPVAPSLAISMVSYIADGRPLERQGSLYASLRLLPDRADHWLAEQLAMHIGRRVQLTLIHDGSAAARVYAGRPNTAAILLGTALGVGFSPNSPTAHPLAPSFTVIASDS